MASISSRMKDKIYTLRYPNRLISAALRKDSAFMGDGTYGMTEMLDDGPVRENVVSSFVLEGRSRYRLHMTLCTGVWLAQLTLALLACVRDIRRSDPASGAKAGSLRYMTLYVAFFGAALVSKWVGFYPVEAGITAGLCMANMGGTGDVAVLSAADRMELMPFAQISSRLGGAIILIIGSLLLSTLGSLL